MRIHLLMLVLGMALLSACKKNAKTRERDTVTSGFIKISVDESLKPLFETEIDTFTGIYPEAKITARYTSEDVAIQDVLKDSSRIAIVTRPLTKEELEIFKKEKLLAFQTIVAKEAVALILHHENPDSVFSVNDVKAIVDGKMSAWDQVNPKSKLGKIEVVLDNPQSGIVRYLKDSISNVAKLPSYFYGVNSNKEVIDYVAKKPNAIGLIGVSWISDGDDPSVSQFLKIIRVASISKDSTAVRPYQAYIANHQYPFRRYVYIISREARAGLGSGFTAFVAGEKGQRIILKSGLVPATVPLRIVEINRNKLE
jgi:phosphate transport system substrate-binding protein